MRGHAAALERRDGAVGRAGVGDDEEVGVGRGIEEAVDELFLVQANAVDGDLHGVSLRAAMGGENLGDGARWR